MCAQSCLTLYNRLDCSPPGSSVHGIFQAGILEWVATSYFRESSQPGDQTCFECEFFTTAQPRHLLKKQATPYSECQRKQDEIYLEFLLMVF